MKHFNRIVSLGSFLVLSSLMTTMTPPCSGKDSQAAPGSVPGSGRSTTAMKKTSTRTFDITEQGAVGDGTTLNTQAIQAAIDRCAAAGGGTVVIPKGQFLSGALFFKGKVNLELREGAVLEGSKNDGDYPILKHTRFEGHFQDRIAALLNVEKSDGFRLTGPGQLNGNGGHYWARPAPLGRPRLCVIRDSRDVVVSGVHFWQSPSWNLHLYNCRDARMENCRFEIARGAPGPSTDGVDIDSSQNTVVRGCYFNVNDDCVCLKGNRYDGLNQEPKSPPVKNVLVENCTFVRGHGALTLGTEAQSISNVEMKNCLVRGEMPVLRLKLRPDTPNQDYTNIRVRDVKLEGTKGEIVRISPYHGTKVPRKPTPISRIRNITIENISGSFGSFGTVSGGTTAAVSDVTFRNVHVTVAGDPNLNTEGTTDVKFENVVVEKTQDRRTSDRSYHPQ